jgi:hypothetical protein
MSNVRSKPLNAPAVAPREASASCMGLIGVVCLLVSIGPLVILLNGGYSIIGMGWLADKLGEYGRLFWALATTYTINVPIAARAGLPLAQPVLPWLMVAGMSFLQISLLINRKRQSSLWIAGAGLLVSVFDYATTTVGLALLPWMAGLGVLRYLWFVVAALLAVPVTFGFEGLVARVLRGR